VFDDLVHGGEEVDDVAVLEHHALGRAGGARRVDDVDAAMDGDADPVAGSDAGGAQAP
jgi:hypothetical protein